ncbi:glycoside hydrolase family 13 protein [Amanita thiersii Skay4041]|uniref:Glycoside hydrolase family 13 protein n=1 Tax=Amanita thiersii Skay4041 TaxID=703135 RepID=A0A2A9NYE4_9AGAR|nr:glycoside hydrolase family 13 protein [Amanita thiersii Skay4041]
MRLGPEDNSDNPLMLQFFTWDTLHPDMSWWQHFEREVPRLAKMGFTQAWLPPPNKAAEVDGRGYDAYDLWDLGEFDQKGSIRTRWGTRQELLKACEAAKGFGIDIIIDTVLNHKLGGDRTEVFNAVPSNPENRLKDAGPVREIEGWTAFDFPGRGDKYSSMRWNEEHFTGIDWDHRTRTKAIYRIVGKDHKGWSHHVDSELGNYDYLLGLDIDYRHLAVQQDLLEWGPWILETMGATGFRLDAIKHIDYRFLLNFIKHSRQKSGRLNMFAVVEAEYWSGNLKSILPYIRIFGGETAFFDVPLHMNFCQAGRKRARYDLRRIFNDTLVSMKPDHAVTFVDNHDTVEGKSLESWVENFFKAQAYALILLRGSGHPCVFYGDLYPNRECYNENIARSLALLIKARKMFAYGATEDYFIQKNCIGFVRMGDQTHPGCAVILSNREDDSTMYVHAIRMNVGKKYAGTDFRSFMQEGGKVTIDDEGWGEFTCFASHVQVWVRSD